MFAQQGDLFLSSSIETEEDIFNDENYTPDLIVEPFRRFVKGFNLDPFSCERANRIIGASTFWDKTDNAFIQNWKPYTRKWVNPPYSKGNIERAVELVLVHAHIGQSFLLVNSNTSSSWFLEAQNKCTCYLTFNRRINFINPAKKKQNSNAKSQTLFYFGDRTPQQFLTVCGHLGNVSVVV